MSRYKAAAYYTVGALWCFFALAVLISIPVAALVGVAVIVGSVWNLIGGN